MINNGAADKTPGNIHKDTFSSNLDLTIQSCKKLPLVVFLNLVLFFKEI